MLNLRNRGHLPHLEYPNSTYFVTFRLAGSVPEPVLQKWRLERKEIVQSAERQKRPLSNYEKERLKYLYSKRLEEYLDHHYGECWLRDTRIAQLVLDTLKHFHCKRYHLEAWCIMPNHVHVVFAAISKGHWLDSDLIPILHSWKSYTSHEANKLLNKRGAFWQQEYYDHLIRSNDEFAHYVEYTLYNPVKVNLCKTWSEYPWAGCSERISQLLQE